MSAAKTHILRVKPPWRDGRNHTMCGRRVSDNPPARRAGYARRESVIEPGAEMAVSAKAALAGTPPFPWGRHVEGVPDGMCAICWDRLGTYGHQEWHANPLAVLRADLAIRDDASSVALSEELIALAELVAAHPGEFRELLETRSGLATLAG